MKRPHVIINCAMSADGKIASPLRKQIRISSDEDLRRVYNLRNKCDAVLVGIGTILSDDPKLTVKNRYVKNPNQPLRIVLDSSCKTPKNSEVLNKQTKTIIICSTGNKKDYNLKHVDVIECNSNKQGLLDLKEVLNILNDKSVNRLLIEGGSTVIWNFLKNKLVDDFYTYIGPIVIGGKNSPTVADGEGMTNKPISLKIKKINRYGEGILIHYKMIK